MDVQGKEFYDLIARSLGNVTFHEYVNTLFADKYNKPETDGFEWEADMRDDFELKQIMAKAEVYTMASYVDLDSPAPLKHTDGVELGSVKIPRMKHGFVMNEKIIRQNMLKASEFNQFSDRMRTSTENVLFDSVDRLLGGNYNSLRYQRHQGVSKGMLDIIAENNPQGIKGVKIDFNVPKNNRWEIAWWNKNGAKNASIDPMKDLKDKVRYITQIENAPVDHIEVNSNTWDAFLELPEVRKAAGRRKNALVTTETEALSVGMNLDDEEMKRVIERYIKAPVKVIDSISAVEQWNAEKRIVEVKNLQSFEENVFVFVPSRNIGKIQAVAPIVIADGSARIATFDGGRTVITQTFDVREKVQYIESELTALCVPNVVQQMYYLTVKASK